MAPSNWFTELLLILERDPDKCDPHDPLRTKLAAWKEKWFRSEGMPIPESVKLSLLKEIRDAIPTDSFSGLKERAAILDEMEDQGHGLAKPPIKRKKGRR
jgi:hypothetical protein